MEQAEPDLSVMWQGNRLYKAWNVNEISVGGSIVRQLVTTNATSEINENVESMSDF